MSDITMCSNTKCYIADLCYRAMAKPNPYKQSYAFFESRKGAYDIWECEHFKPLNKQEKT